MYEVEFTQKAEDDLRGLDKPVVQAILDKLYWFSEHLDRVTPEPLTGPLRGLFKFRAGDYRILYALNQADRKIRVELVRHRRKVYKIG